MRYLLPAIVLLAACSDPAPERTFATEPPPPVAPVSDLHFKDEQLQAIAAELREQAHVRGIRTSPGRNRIERLLALEAAVSGEGLAFKRVNALMRQITATDASQWGKLRQRAEKEFATGNDEVAKRVQDLLARWQRRKADIVFTYLSTNYRSTHIRSIEWERRFHEFVTERPYDTATWGWLLLREYADEAQQQYGRADAESAYRFYIVFSGLNDGSEARRMFSVPGIEIRQ